MRFFFARFVPFFFLFFSRFFSLVACALLGSACRSLLRPFVWSLLACSPLSVVACALLGSLVVDARPGARSFASWARFSLLGSARRCFRSLLVRCWLARPCRSLFARCSRFVRRWSLCSLLVRLSLPSRGCGAGFLFVHPDSKGRLGGAPRIWKMLVALIVCF